MKQRAKPQRACCNQLVPSGVGLSSSQSAAGCMQAWLPSGCPAPALFFLREGGRGCGAGREGVASAVYDILIFFGVAPFGARDL